MRRNFKEMVAVCSRLRPFLAWISGEPTSSPQLLRLSCHFWGIHEETSFIPVALLFTRITYSSKEEEKFNPPRTKSNCTNFPLPPSLNNIGTKVEMPATKETKESTSLISAKAKKDTVQHAMNLAVGTSFWYGKRDIRWRNLILVRSQFVADQLQKNNLANKDFVAFTSTQKRDEEAQMKRSFTAEFSQYSRDNDWMQEAVGENPAWILVLGMTDWHVMAAFYSLSRGYSVIHWLYEYEV